MPGLVNPDLKFELPALEAPIHPDNVSAVRKVVTGQVGQWGTEGRLFPYTVCTTTATQVEHGFPVRGSDVGSMGPEAYDLYKRELAKVAAEAGQPLEGDTPPVLLMTHASGLLIARSISHATMGAEAPIVVATDEVEGVSVSDQLWSTFGRRVHATLAALVKDHTGMCRTPATRALSSMPAQVTPHTKADDQRHPLR